MAEEWLTAASAHATQAACGGLQLLGQGVAVDAELPRCGALVAFVGSQDLLQVDALELASRQLQGNSPTHHLGYEGSQLFAHFILSNDRIGTPKVAPWWSK